ncbi:MAG TPA: alginate export family protein [Gammaproteobacteria bacterium]|nr:alginate export family protein [Gammaproteobacteria bacterium]
MINNKAVNTTLAAGGHIRLIIIMLAGLLPLTAQAAATLLDAFTYGKFSGQLRYRYETVDQENFALKAYGSTLRTQLGYLTDGYQGFSAFVQVENVAVLGNEQYNSTANGRTQYPTIADPDDTELNQAYLNYETPFSTNLKYGRQVINLDNQRFIGNAGWRQNEQTFDAFSIVSTWLTDTTATYAHITNVNRVFSESNPNRILANSEMTSDIINASYKGFSAGTLTGYGYLLDFDNSPTLSNQTWGARFDGGYRPGKVKWLYTAEYADQSDYASGTSTNDGHYGLLALGGEYNGVQIKLNYELLSGDGVYGFATPLATLHAFNGWADMFLNTPRDGLQDIFVNINKTIMGVNLAAIYHDYMSDNLNYDYGTEWNFLATKKIAKNLALTLKYAAYKGDKNADNTTRNIALTRDVDKLWLQADYQF